MTVSMPISARFVVLAFVVSCMAQIAAAQTRAAASPGAAPLSSRQPAEDTPTLSVVEWLQRMHAAARQRSYVGTFVVSAAAGNLSSARIWHVCEGDLQVERVE